MKNKKNLNKNFFPKYYYSLNKYSSRKFFSNIQREKSQILKLKQKQALKRYFSLSFLEIIIKSCIWLNRMVYLLCKYKNCQIIFPDSYKQF